MRKQILLLLAVLILVVLPVHAQDPIWLPIVMGGNCGEWPTMSDWKVVVPIVTTNLISHPSVEDSDISGFVAVNGATRARSSAQSRWALYSLAITPHAANLYSGVYYQVAGAATTTYTFSLWVRGENGVAYRLILQDGVPATLATQTFTGTGDWQLVEVTGTTAANPNVRCRIAKDTGGGSAFYADGWQLEQDKSYSTTYVDGDQDGCEWNGAEHTSTSTRSAQSRAGGRIRDLQTDYSFDIGGMTGGGMAPQNLSVDEYALLPGGEMSGVKITARTFTLTGVIRGTSYADLHAKRQALILLFDPNAVPEDEDGPQPVRLRYTGAAVEKQIAVHYETGLTGSIRATDPCWWERVAIRFLADDPFWYEIGESAAVLDSNDTANVYRMVGRLRSTGQWDNLGLAADIATGSGVWNVLAASDGDIYIAGEFTQFGGVAGRDYVARYVPSTGTWETVGGASDFTDIIRCLAEGPDGIIYAGGDFNVAGGDPADYLAQYNPSTNTWSAVAAGGTGDVYALTFDGAGNLYIGGSFTNWGGIAAADNIAMWDGSAYSAVGASGASTTVSALRGAPVEGTNVVYAGGAFATIAGVTVNGTARWDGTNWTALSSGINIPQTVYDIAVGPDGRVYFVGDFTTAGGITVNYAAVWNGTAWNDLAGGLNGEMRGVEIADDGMVWMVGQATATTSGITIDRIAKWNGSSWSATDLDLPGSNALGNHVIAITRYDPVVPTNYDIYIGTRDAGAAAYFAGSATAINDGTTEVYPVIVVERSGGTSARLQQIRNETIGKELLFDYSLLDGETLTIDLAPTEKSIISNFFGDRMDAILAGCDFGSFVLQSGSNNITCFVDVAGAPTMTTYMLWQDTFTSYD